MMKKELLTLCLLLGLSTIGQTQTPHKQQSISIAFYNLENLFDTEDGENNDAEFLPDGENRWTEDRYQKKLHNMATAISRLVDGHAPSVLGVCEIENRKVLQDLISQPELSPLGYSIVHFESPDKRGIDCGFIYRPEVFKLTNASPHPVNIPGESYIKTRDVIEVNGLIAGEPVSVLVAHWPSRAGGEEVSIKRRKAAAQVMYQVADSLLRIDKDQKVILMGDFNDDPTSPAVKEGLHTNNDLKTLQPNQLFNTLAELYVSTGTLGYQDILNLFDNIVVSGNLIYAEPGKLRLVKNEKNDSYGQISRLTLLTQQTGKFKGYPLRTFSYGKFKNGYSDHLPVYIHLTK